MRTNQADQCGMYSALFLDLGGTLVRIEDDEIFTDAAGNVELLPNTVEILMQRAQDFDAIFIITNQSGIEKGTLSIESAKSFIDQVNTATGGIITDYWVCPRIESPYRKPNPNMITGLADKHFVDVKQSVLVGDTEIDQQAAQNAGIGHFIWARDFFKRQD
ncbi:MAG: HAD-IIIA family hydrolase [Gemmatimonadetes bacterium]|nr:HAD-IIIA family hydrolase [Gemmatimonadota bacterium]